MLIIGLCLGLLVVLFLIGVPVGFSFALVVVLMSLLLGYDLGFLLPYAFEKMSSMIILSIPLFIIAGIIMERGNITGPLIDFVDSLVGRIRGGLGAAGAIADAIFGAISGSASAAIACIGTIMIPRLVEEGYPRGYASSLMSAAAGIALLIPPSFSMILYGWITNTSITACFLAGAVPGVLLTLIFILINWVMMGRYHGVRRPTAWPGIKKVGQEVGRTGWRALPALFMPVLILGTIYGGVATPTEAAAVAAVYAIPVGFLIYKGLTPRNFASALTESATTIGAVMVSLFFAMILGRMLVMENIPQAIAAFMTGVTENKYLLLLMVNAFLFLVGMFMDDITGMIICASLLLPIIKAIGISPVHFAAIITTNLTMGLMTPPMAPLIFLGQMIGKTTFPDMIKTSLLFVFLGYLPVVLITTYFAPIAEWLPVAALGAKVLIPAY
ncbi:TRAP transporter large permease [Chloroflexota bacterium]